MSGDFYRLRAPTRWVTEVEQLSFSSLTALERCPRQWQMLRSAWGDFERLPARENPRAIAGTIVHEALDALFRALALRGLPARGTDEFRAVVRAVDVPARVRAALDAYHARLQGHPRRLSFQLPSDAATLYNEVSQLFQTTYASVDPSVAVMAPPGPRAAKPDREMDPGVRLSRMRVLTELPVEHPTLPLRGVIDLLRRDDAGTHVADFKTGAPKPEHQEQLTLYALMWWRTTGDLPVGLELRHPKGCERYPVSRESLLAVERRLSARVDAVRAALEQTPAPAKVGEHCAHCDARPFCDDYWAKGAAAKPVAEARGGGWIDAEVIVPPEVTPHGFEGSTRDGRTLTVVYDEENGAVHGPFEAGARLRILRATSPTGSGPGALRLQRTSEVFHARP